MKAQEKTRTPHSLRFNVWLYFLLFSAVLVIMVWMFEVAAFRIYYQRMRQTEVRNIAYRLADLSDEISSWEEFRDAAELAAVSYGVAIIIYNAKGDETGRESIGIATSDDMLHWKRCPESPVLDHPEGGITGDAQIVKMGKLYVMFYFGAFWKGKPAQAFNRFACSYDLKHWTDWTGDDLVAPSEPYDNVFAHKSFVLRYKGVVYHFYCAVNDRDQRGIAVATSRDMGSSSLQFDR